MIPLRTCLALALASAGLCGRADTVRPPGPPRSRESFNSGWLFARGDPADAGRSLDYGSLKPWLLATGPELLGADRPAPARPAGDPGSAVSYVQPGFDDRAWRRLDLPHDWGIEGPFRQELPGETGKLAWVGSGWYRKHFALPASDASCDVFLDVDGAMAYSEVWLNGRFVGGWPYGYASYRLDLTPFIRPGGPNVLAIRLDNPPDSSRWYPGGGIYRNVWLVRAPRVRIAHWGTFVTTPRVSDGEALVNVDFEIEARTGPRADLEVRTRVFDLGPDGRRGSGPVAVSQAVAVGIDPALARSASGSNLLRVTRPRLWDLAHPNRYVAVTTVSGPAGAIDEVETPFGIRTIAFDAAQGFLLNGRRVPIQGVCDHHDLGALGTALNVRALERQIEILQGMGCNAIRTSHNPPAPELLDLCDSMGILVMDEAFDCWHLGKRPEPDPKAAGPFSYNDYGRLFDDWHERDLRALVRRDRNHPCVILWSIGNEIREQETSDGWKLARALAGIVREEDRTRGVTAALNFRQSGYDGFQGALDIVGFNYKPDEYARFRLAHPTIPVFGSETASCVSSRGEYVFPVEEDKAGGRAGFQVSSYDLYAPHWAFPPDTEFRGLDAEPSAAGEFVWTGFDYIGEPTPFYGDAPSRSSYFGIVDLAGFPKDRYYLYQARWRPQLPMAHILPHWNWPERVGQVTPVMVYTSGDEAELFLNGRSLGRRARGPLAYRLRWDGVRYEPGELRVVAYRQGKKWAESTVRTTGPAARVLLAADRAALRADGTDLAFVTVTVADREGRAVPRSRNPIRFSVTGPAEIAGVDNGDATSFESFRASERSAYNGLALAILRTRKGQAGAITLKAESEGLAPAEVALQSVAP